MMTAATWTGCLGFVNKLTLDRRLLHHEPANPLRHREFPMPLLHSRMGTNKIIGTVDWLTLDGDVITAGGSVDISGTTTWGKHLRDLGTHHVILDLDPYESRYDEDSQVIVMTGWRIIGARLTRQPRWLQSAIYLDPPRKAP